MAGHYCMKTGSIRRRAVATSLCIGYWGVHPTYGGAIGTPTLDVNGTMLPNNPPLEEILRHL
jgi:hypothetical protein